ncbi:MAG: FAD-dependent oxidoreductase [Nanoarchaeota archaeon]|nr:FAD-dependent oxidoreductase [Nanoarchaeota archaeon]
MKQKISPAIFDVIIIGGGISGTSLAYVLSKYTNVKNIALLEKYKKLAQVNSANWNNSQTLHFGDIETNYTAEKAKKVKDGADLVKNYLIIHDKNKKIHNKTKKMVLGVGKEQVKKLEERYKEFKNIFPNLSLLYKKELAKIEPNITKDRNPDEPIVAMVSEDGYAVDFGRLSESFISEAEKSNTTLKCFMGCEVWDIKKKDGMYVANVCGEMIQSKVVVIAAGSHSLKFAQQLGYADDIILLPVAGSFYKGSNLLKNKVYTTQIDKLPFAAIHGDPDVNTPSITRFGPTAKVLPILERRNLKSFYYFLEIFQFRIDAIIALLSILKDRTLFNYIIKEFLLDMPIIGKFLFLKEIKKIIPSIKWKDIKFARKYGGIRPQIVNVKTKTLDMGEAKIMGDNIIFNITPSPGATTCLKNAENDAKTITKMLNKRFNESKFSKDLRQIL